MNQIFKFVKKWDFLQINSVSSVYFILISIQLTFVCTFVIYYKFIDDGNKYDLICGGLLTQTSDMIVCTLELGTEYFKLEY